MAFLVISLVILFLVLFSIGLFKRETYMPSKSGFYKATWKNEPILFLIYMSLQLVLIFVCIYSLKTMD